MAKSHIEKLVDEALAIEAEAAKEAGALGYMARALVQATMPHSNPGNVEAWGRENGAFSMIMQPGVMKKNGELIRIGLPYGSVPRLLLSWVTTEAVKKKSPNLVLGPTLSGFMQQLGLIPAGGRWGTITRLREQMKRLFSSSISCYYNEDFTNHSEDQVLEIARAGFNITKSYHLWWDPKQPSQAGLWESEVTLSRDFFDEITAYPVPIDMRVLKAIKRSPMSLDIYCWLTYRMSYLKKTTQIPWQALQTQFGSAYAHDQQGIRNFKRAFLRELHKVQQFYQHVRADDGEYGLILKPSFSHIPKKPKIQLPEEYKNKAEPSESDGLFTKLRELYTHYRHTRLAEIVKNEIDENDKKSLCNEFSTYLKRNQVKGISPYSLEDSRTQEWLYRFVDNNWHHLIEQIKSFDEFTADEPSS